MGLQMEERPDARDDAGERLDIGDHGVFDAARTVVGPVRGGSGQANSG